MGLRIYFEKVIVDFLNCDNYFTINENVLSNCIEGQRRPGFFIGVLTIVSKLFNIVNPTSAFFGKKDPQQLLLIKRLCKDLNYNIKIVSCETVREKNGLAMSSRNNYLTNKERLGAGVIFLALERAKVLLKKNLNIDLIKAEMNKIILSNSKMKIDYISFSQTLDLTEIENIDNNQILVSVAVFIGKTRLIDSFFFPDF